MFTLRPESIKTFTNDQTIRLPRFQRKQTWNEKKNFNLCLSLYKNYPLGVVVIKIESSSGKSKELIKWLLDGRQRQNALKNMKNPERIYQWARFCLQTKDEDALAKSYWDYIEEYLEDEEAETDICSPSLIVEETDDSQYQDDSLESQDGQNNGDDVQKYSKDATKYDGLNDLLDLLMIVYPVRGKMSGFTRPFDFHKWIPRLEYIMRDPSNGVEYVDSDALITWIDSRRAFGVLTGKTFPPTKDDFIAWLVADKTLDDDIVRKVSAEVGKRWRKIEHIFTTLDSLDKRLQEAKIGYLELTNDCTDGDAKKIFEIINTAGTPLTAAEILSAKPSWNRKAPNPHPQIVKNKNDLYTEIGIKVDQSGVSKDDVVRWDIAATVMDRLESPLDMIVGDWRGNGGENLEKKITLGFKLMSGYYTNNISRENLSTLTNDRALLDKGVTINWGTLEMEENMNTVGRILLQNNFFKYLQSWKTPLINILSDALAINFLLMVTKDWIIKGRPTNPASTEYRLFQTNAIILFDRSVYEYATKKWRGSSDSMIANNLEDLALRGHIEPNLIFDQIGKGEWTKLIEELVEEGTINGQSCSQKLDSRVKAVLYYYYLLKEKGGPSDPTLKGIDVDHIMPQSAFSGLPPEMKKFANNITNLALLPKRENISKGDSRLNEVTDSWLKDQIRWFEEIPETQFEEFSDINKYQELKKLRENLIKTAYDEGRDKIIRIT